MALETPQQLLRKAVSNVQTLRKALIDQSTQIAKEREANATKQTLEQQLLPKPPGGG